MNFSQNEVTVFLRCLLLSITLDYTKEINKREKKNILT